MQLRSDRAEARPDDVDVGVIEAELGVDDLPDVRRVPRMIEQIEIWLAAVKDVQKAMRSGVRLDFVGDPPIEDLVERPSRFR